MKDRHATFLAGLAQPLRIDINLSAFAICAIPYWELVGSNRIELLLRVYKTLVLTVELTSYIKGIPSIAVSLVPSKYMVDFD